MGVCNCSMFCCTLLYVHSSIAIILMGKRELIALLNLSSWCLVMVEQLFLAVPRGSLQFVIVVFPDHTHLLFFKKGGRFKAINYSPVSLTSLCCKLQEHIITSNIVRYLDDNSILTTVNMAFEPDAAVKRNSSLLPMNWQNPSTRQDKWISSSWTSQRHLTAFHINVS